MIVAHRPNIGAHRRSDEMGVSLRDRVGGCAAAACARPGAREAAPW